MPCQVGHFYFLDNYDILRTNAKIQINISSSPRIKSSPNNILINLKFPTIDSSHSCGMSSYNLGKPPRVHHIISIESYVYILFHESLFTTALSLIMKSGSRFSE